MTTSTPNMDALLARFLAEYPRPRLDPMLDIVAEMSFLVGVQMVLQRLDEERQQSGEQGAMQANATLRSEAKVAVKNAKCEAATLVALHDAMNGKP